MTQQQMIEMVQISHPDVGETQLRLLLNGVLDEFTSETRILSGSSTVSATLDKRVYDLTDFSGVTDADDVLEIYKVDWVDDSESTDTPIPRFAGMIANEDMT